MTTDLKLLSRSHAPRGNALLGALRRIRDAGASRSAFHAERGTSWLAKQFSKEAAHAARRPFPHHRPRLPIHQQIVSLSMLLV